MIKKRIFNWDHSKNKKYAGRKCPDFDFAKGCQDGTVIWWNETQFCIMQKYRKILQCPNNVLRGLVYAEWVFCYNKLPSINFKEAIEKSIFLNDDIKNKLLNIIELKKKGKEKVL